MQVGWLVVTGLAVLAVLTDGRAMQRKKRDADALAGGVDWFSSFYTLFDDKDDKSPKAAEKADPKPVPTPPVTEQHAAGTPRPTPGSLPVESFFPEINNAGGQEAPRQPQSFEDSSPSSEFRQGQGPVPTTNVQDEPQHPVHQPEAGHGHGKTGSSNSYEPNLGYEPSPPYGSQDENSGFTYGGESNPTDEPVTFEPLPSIPISGGIYNFPDDPTTGEDPFDFANLPTNDPTLPSTGEMYEYPDPTETTAEYYDPTSPYDAEDLSNVQAAAYSTDWFNNFDTRHIYNNYGVQPGYSFGGILPNDWYHSNTGYQSNPWQQGYGLGDPFGLQLNDENEAGPDEEGADGTEFGGQNLDASMFLDDIDLFRTTGLHQDEEEDEQAGSEEEPVDESYNEAGPNEYEASPADPEFYDPSSNSFENFMDMENSFDPSSNYAPQQQPEMGPGMGWTPANSADAANNDFAANIDFADFMMSSMNPDNEITPETFDMLFGDPSYTYDPSEIPNKPSTASGVPNKGSEEIPLNPDGSLGFSLKDPGYRLPKEECHTAKGAIGECLSAYDCGLEDGELDGLCHQGHDSSYHLRSCCVYTSYCGFETNKEVTYLKNPDYPSSTKSGGDCVFKIDLLPGVCQIRLDFLELELKPLVNGECDERNALHIGSNDPGAFIPVKKLCGTVSSDVEDSLRTDIPHVYVHVDRDAEAAGFLNHRPPNKDDISVKLTLKVDDYPSKWNIRASQISCDGANLQAPVGCGQYYNSNSGNISSFNFKDGQYMKDLSLSACIKRDPLACGVEYNFKHLGIGDTKGGQGKLGYGLTCKDYLLINGERTALCGSQNLPRKMVFPAHGPESIFFSSDDEFKNKVDVGYSLEYSHLRNCTGVEFFKYPVKR